MNGSVFSCCCTAREDGLCPLLLLVPLITAVIGIPGTDNDERRAVCSASDCIEDAFADDDLDAGDDVA